MSGTDYETDFYGWTLEQARLLREGRLSELDLGNVAEEIESMGRGEQQQLVNRLTVLLAHLLKWQYQPELRGRSWRLTIVEQRRRLIRHMNKNPSLKAEIDEAMIEAYEIAILQAARETLLPETTFPGACPWAFEQALDEAFWPG
jgi:hypothetical protein